MSRPWHALAAVTLVATLRLSGPGPAAAGNAPAPTTLPGRATSTDSEQARAEISGRLLDAQGLPIGGALVVAFATGAGAIYDGVATWSDRQGEFEFTTLRPGRYVVVAFDGRHAPRSTPELIVHASLRIELVLFDASIAV